MRPNNPGKCPEISLNAITGSLSQRTMHVKSKIGSKRVTILIDSSSIHNFLDPALLSRVPLPILIDAQVKFKVANGKQVDSDGKVMGVSLYIQGQVFQVDMYLLVLAGCDLAPGLRLHLMEFQRVHDAIHS